MAMNGGTTSDSTQTAGSARAAGDGTRATDGSTMTVKELAEMAGVSARTLRYYESIGLLHPARTETGWRIYNEGDARSLAQVLAMRACGLPLSTIRRLCSSKDVDLLATLREHLAVLQRQQASTTDALRRTRAAIHAIERMRDMTTEESFAEMKREGLRQFEETYGAEARERYGSDAIDAANERMMNLTKDEWDAKELLEEAIKVQLRIARATDDPTSPEAAELVSMHRRWITIHWGPGYDTATYLALVRGYLADPRFMKHYDSAAGEGATEFLVQAVEAANHEG